MSGEDPTVIVPIDELLSEHPAPKLAGAPAWAQVLSDRIHAMELRQQSDRHRLGGEMMTLRGEVHQIDKALGAEPGSDGTGGKGLIGDVRKLAGDISTLLTLKAQGMGFVAAIVLFGAIIVAGLIHLVQNVAGAK